uniref:Cytospin-A n=1 Tax=Echinostoma caproni TaxID=27848 RepID=A0A183B2T1_9TREM
LSGLSSSGTLEAQRAYLTALQGKTASEREEIARLLRQRDELAARLSKLKAAADAASQHADAVSAGEAEPKENEGTNGAAGSSHASSPEPDLEPIMLAHLEAKKRELVQLKAQLELFRKAEERMAALQLDDQAPPEVEIPKSCVVKGGSRSGRHTRSHRPSPPPSNSSVKAHFIDSLGNENETAGSEAPRSDTQTPTKLDTVTFQQPEGTCINDNTERLYENMREARIRLEEQRGNRSVGGNVPVAGIAAVLSATGKAMLSGGGAASVATSQDRTTLATWGGSSSTGSSTTSNSIDGTAEESAAVTAPTAPQLMTTLTNGIVSSRPKTVQDTQTTECHESRRTRNEKRSRASKATPFVAGGPDLLDPNSLPQLGRSPSPPGTAINRVSQTGTNFVTEPQAGDTSLDSETPGKNGIAVDKECGHSVYCAALVEHDQCNLSSGSRVIVQLNGRLFFQIV